MSNTPVALITNRPDIEVAKDLKTEILTELEDVCGILDKANAAGFHISFNIAPRWDGKQIVNQLTIAKHF